AQGNREIAGNYEEKVKIQILERIFGCFHAVVSTDHIEINVLGKSIDEVPALCCEAFIHNAQAQVTDPGVQGVSEYDQHVGRWKHQLNQQDALASQLLDFLGQESEVTTYRGKHGSSYPLNCILRI